MRIEHQPSKLRVAGSSPAGRATRADKLKVSMVDVAQMVEPRIVIPVVVGSSPIVHPSDNLRFGAFSGSMRNRYWAVSSIGRAVDS